MTTLSNSSIEPEEYQRFLRDFYQGEKFKGQRLGQAFWNHYKLQKVADQESLGNLYELDGQQALDKIRAIFNFS